MSAFKIFEVANELNTTSDILMAICKKIGIKVKSNGSSIDEEQKNMVIAEFKSRSEKAEKKAPAKKTDVAVKAKPAKKTAAKKSSSSKIKWIKISESPGAAGEVKEDTEEQESAIDEQAAVSEVKETVKTAKTVKTPAKKTAGAAKSAESKPAGKKPEDLTDLKEEMKILKEKERIEEERLSDLKKARRIEQMKELQDRVKQALFRKEPQLREELKQEKKGCEETETKKQAEQKTEEKKEKPKKSFFSNFIEIKTAAEIAKEEEERSKQEEERALKDQLEISKLLQPGSQETKSNIPADNSGPNFSALFPEQTQNMQDTEDSIQLDQGYKIKIVKNK